MKRYMKLHVIAIFGNKRKVPLSFDFPRVTHIFSLDNKAKEVATSSLSGVSCGVVVLSGLVPGGDADGCASKLILVGDSMQW